MHHPERVRLGHRFSGLEHVVDRLLDGQPATLLEEA
jgi:hypothetical protein